MLLRKCLLYANMFSTPQKTDLRTFPGGGLLDNLSSGISAFGAMAGSGKIVSAEDQAEQQRQGN